MVLLAFAAGGSSSERKRSRPIRAFSATPHDGQRRCRTLLKIPTESSPELRISPALQLKREWSPWPEFGSDPGNPRELGWCRPRKQASPPRSWPRPELRIPNAAAQTRIVSKARIRLDFCKSVRSFKGIICQDIFEFECLSIGAGL